MISYWYRRFIRGLAVTPEARSRLAVALVFVLTVCVSATLALLLDWPAFDPPTFPEPWR
jgi:hypothetical protein